ncbi:gamma-glutamylcyclotransferase family protein [Calycomorphotria hydatis]|nr:gamma-glutamylcyclotransferase family protein [Calycomorphotria hydatis]
MNKRLPLFVFGTLRRGEVNHHYLAGRYERMIPATLAEYAVVDELMIDRVPGEKVSGELYFLRTDIYDDTMRHCDDLEEIPPGEIKGEWYERREVVVDTAEGEVTAWAYVAPD